MFHLDASDTTGLQQYLQSQRGEAGEHKLIRVTKPGEGNMNYVLRVYLDNGTFIIKQARPYVEKYPQIAAPVERSLVEAAFYSFIQRDAVLKSYTPMLLWADEANHVIALEDLGQANDYTELYQLSKKLTIDEVHHLVAFISRLHNHMPETDNSVFRNRGMRELNHQHIFLFPFMEENGFNLDSIQPGLQALAMKYKSETVLKKMIHGLGEIYLQDGECLLHGDYYPGSWLNTEKGIKIIDPEFCFYGPAVFDLAVMRAHCIMTQQDQSIIDAIYSSYEKTSSFDSELYNRFTGVEIMRRLIGLAQVPLTLPLAEKENLLNKAARLLQS